MKVCYECGRSFNGFNSLLTHASQVHTEEAQEHILLKELKMFLREKGEIPNQYTLNNADEYPSVQAYRRLFGNLSKALKEVDVPDDIGVYECEICGAVFGTYRAMDSHRGKSHKDEYEGRRVEVECEVCGKKEKVKPSRVDRYRACSIECRLALPKEGARVLSEEQEEQVAHLYVKEGKTIRQIADKMDTNYPVIRQSLLRQNVELREPTVDYNKGFECDDGHIADSRGERGIDNWLYHNNVVHKIHPLIGQGRMRADFYLPKQNIYVEYWGMEGFKDYNQRQTRKLQVYDSFGINLIEIHPRDDFKSKLKKAIR